MISINDCLGIILQDFRQYAESGDRLCKLKNVHFDAGRIPDYSDVNVQQLYLLRYAYAYAFEYKHMYRELLERLNDIRQISVTSVGCGSMIDYWSLKHALPPWCKIDYIGVDKIDWSYKDIFCNHPDVEFKEGDFVDFIKNNDIIATDIYMFPKSISELSFDEINCICGELSRLVPRGKSVYFLFSLRSNDISLQIDCEKTKYLFGLMLSLGFSSNDSPNVYRHFKDQSKKIREIDGDFSHPRGVVDYLTNSLPNCCEHYDALLCDSDCKKRLGWWPILNCGQATWQIFEFKKEA